jgi:hypothetical protein
MELLMVADETPALWLDTLVLEFSFYICPIVGSGFSRPVVERAAIFDRQVRKINT